MRRQHLIVVATSVLVTLLALAPIAWMAYRNQPPRIAQVDLQKLVEEEQQRAIDVLGKGGGVISDEQRTAVEKLSIDFAKQLSATIDAIGADCGCVIVNKAAVLGGSVIDFTDTVRLKMKR